MLVHRPLNKRYRKDRIGCGTLATSTEGMIAEVPPFGSAQPEINDSG